MSLVDLAIRLGLPQVATPLRADLRPIGGIQPGAFGFNDSTGRPLTVGTGLTRVATPLGWGIDCTAANTGLTRAISVTDAPLSCPFILSPDTVGGNVCFTSIASTADKTARIFINASGQVFAQHIGATTNASATTSQAFTFGGWVIGVAVFGGPTDLRVYARGDFAGPLTASSTTNVGALGAMTKLAFGTYDGSVKATPFDGRMIFCPWFATAFTDEFARRVLFEPELLFEPQRILVPVASAAGSHASSGALAADAAVIAGTATHFTLHTSTGALASQAATIAGSAVHPHIASGAMASDAATIAGDAEHTEPGGATHTSTGALSSDAAVIEGSAAHYTLHASSGALAADAATIAGTAARLALHTASGALQSEPAVIAGQAARPGTDAGVIGRRRRTRTVRPPVEEQPQEAAAPAPLNLKPPTTSLVPDANTLVVASGQKAVRLAKTALNARRAAIELNDEAALERALMDFF